MTFHFTAESKAFCSYDTKTSTQKVRWWLFYIFRAAPRFWFWTLRDTLSR